MNLVFIEGTSKYRDLAEDVAHWCLDRLLPNYRSITVDIVFRNLSYRDYVGLCEWMDTNVRPREFEISVERGFGKENVIKTVIHEMVHVKQYVKSELAERYKYGHQQLWKKQDYSDAGYDDQPWEIEAYKLQDILYDEYINSNEAG